MYSPAKHCKHVLKPGKYLFYKITMVLWLLSQSGSAIWQITFLFKRGEPAPLPRIGRAVICNGMSAV